MDNLRGALLMILAMAGFAVEDACLKIVMRHLPLGEVLVFIGLGGGLAFAVIASRAGLCPWSRSFFAGPVLVRNAGEIVGTGAYVTALALIPLSLASALLQATPLFVTLGAILFLKSRVGWRRWLALAIGLAGVLVILRPGLAGFRPEALIGIVAVAGLGMRDLATRSAPAAAPPLLLACWGVAMAVPTGAVLLAISGGAARPTGEEAALLGGAIAVGMTAYYLLTKAMQTGEIAYVTPFRYIRLVFGIALGWALFHERPDGLTFLGGFIVVGAGLYALLRERRGAGSRPFQTPPAGGMRRQPHKERFP